MLHELTSDFTSGIRVNIEPNEINIFSHIYRWQENIFIISIKKLFTCLSLLPTLYLFRTLIASM